MVGQLISTEAEIANMEKKFLIGERHA